MIFCKIQRAAYYVSSTMSGNERLFMESYPSIFQRRALLIWQHGHGQSTELKIYNLISTVWT